MQEINLNPAGYIPDVEDSNDIVRHEPVHYKSNVFPEEFSLYKSAPAPMSQGSTSACTAFAGMSFVYTLTKRMLGKGLLCNPYDLYAHARMLGGIFPKDGGAYLRDTMKVIHEIGVIPFNSGIKDVRSQPEDYKETRWKLWGGYQRVTGDRGDVIEQMMSLLYHERLPLVVGMSLPAVQVRRIALGDTGTLTWTGEERKNVEVYNHAMTPVGWDRTRVMCWNSWGRKAGLHGYIWVDNRYFRDPTWVRDIWTAINEHA